MAKHIYLSMIPESLVVSMLPPEKFGAYLAVGTRKRSSGQAMFFEVDPGFRSDFFDLEAALDRCVPHPDGEPKHSVYAGIYRVLEHVPLSAVGDLWLATRDGRVLGLERGVLPEQFPGTYHLYQEICPVHPLIASWLTPDKFCAFITDTSTPVSVPRICFVDLKLHGLADDPRNADVRDLPYANIEHLRDCLCQLDQQKGKHTKTVDRIQPQQFPYRCVRTGFYLGDQDGMLFYPFPSAEELETDYYAWWRSVNV
ncbi:MAG: hypothetical protein R6X33_16095 [Candidatus Brocadiia bacterium]